MGRRSALGALVVLGLTAGRGDALCWWDHRQQFSDGGTGARTLPGYTIWQSFTPTATGRLCQIDMGFFNDMRGQGTLLVREGEGTAGAILQSVPVQVVANSGGGVTWNAWLVSVPVVAGSRFTFELVPDAATLPDPYGVAIGSNDPYPLGVMGIDDPSGSYPTTFDTNFRTHVDPQAPPEISIYRSGLAEGVVAPANLLGATTSPPFDDPAPLAVRVNHYAADDGTGAPATILVTKRPGGGVSIDWD